MLLRIGLVLAVLALAGGVAASPSPANAGPACAANPAIDAEEQQLADLINGHRVAHGLPPLTLSTTLSSAASWKATHMAGGDYFDHTDRPSGRAFFDRLNDCGYAHNTWRGENISAGSDDARGTFQQWIESSGHNENMLNEHYVAIGIGRAYDAGSTYGWYWTADFGGVADEPPPSIVFPAGAGDVDCTANVDSVDALLILQLAAALLSALPCGGDADIDGDGAVDAEDATLVLQFAAGLLIAAAA